MCGIYGIALPDPTSRLEPALLERMDAAFPRMEGASAPARWLDAQAGLGARGHAGRHHGIARREQAEGTVALAFHGTRYGANGDRSDGVGGERVASDLLERYLAAGVGAFESIRGDFALAVWDGRRRALFLAVDRFRVHSLVYADTPDGLVFASRLQAILASGALRDRALSPESVVDVVGSSYIPSPRTIYRNIRKLPAGSYLEWSDGRSKVDAYWNLEFRHPDPASGADLERRVRERFDDAIAVRLAAEPDPAKLGTFLSGGIDSSTVTGVLARCMGAPLKSFSIGFGERRFNEMDYARIAARAFGVEHHEYFVTPKDALETIPLLLDHFDEPFANASAIPTYQCARFARDHGVETLYAGDGGDELFAGNERYATRAVYAPYLRVPKPLREGVVRPLATALAGATRLPLFQRAARYAERASLPYEERMTAHAFLRVTPLAAVFDADFLRTLDPSYVPYAMMGRYYREAPASHDLDRELYLDLKLAISDNDLFKVVRMTEAAGIGVRFPFLDGPLAELAMRVPAKLKMRGTELRTFFKAAYADLLPAEVRAKQKHGFGLPIPVWLRTDPELHALMRELVLGERLAARGLFAPGALETLVHRHETDTTSFYGTILWNIMVLELWLRRA